MTPTIAEFIEGDINFSFLFAVVKRLNGVSIDPTILGVLFPDSKPPKEEKPPKESKPPKEDPPPLAVVSSCCCTIHSFPLPVLQYANRITLFVE
jgi:hypothetical protein